MTGLEGFLTDPNTIEKVADKSEGLIKGLFGKAFSEAGELITDNVRYRRAKNQVKIFEKAEKFLKDRGVNNRIKMDLKALAPLLQYCSLEENDDLQDKWAKLIANILSRPTSMVLQQNAIGILNKISNEEVVLLDHIYKTLQKKRIKSLESYNQRDISNSKPRTMSDFRIDNYSFKISDLCTELKCGLEEIEIQISNLVALGTLKYELEVDVLSATKNEGLNNDEVDIDLDVTDYEKVRITKLGFVFVELCTLKEETNAN